MKKITTIMCVLMALLMLLSACGQEAANNDAVPAVTANSGAVMPEGDDADNEVEATQVSEEEIDAQQFINYILYYDPSVIDGTMTNKSMDAMIICNVNVPLTEIAQGTNGLKIVGGGAESWEVSDDGLVYTFKLRDFNWEDGVKVTAEQYAYSIRRILDPANASPVSYMLFDIKNAAACVKGEITPDEVGIKALDENTLEITLEKVTPYFVQLTYQPYFTPTREDLVNEWGSQFGTSVETTMSCGPFKLSEWVHDSKMTLVKNDAYWNAEEVKLGQINLKLIRDMQAMMSELMNHTIDRASVSVPEWRQKLIATNEFSYGDYILSGTYSLFMNTKYVDDNGNNILGNAKVRRAIAACIDKEEAAMMLKTDMAIPATGYVPSELQMDGINFRNESGYNVMEAFAESVSDPKALLIEGLTELGLDPDPSLYSIEYLVGSTAASSKTEAEYFYEVIKNNLGLNLEVVQVESGVARQRRADGEFGMTYVTSYADYNDPSTYLNGWATYLEKHNTNTGYDNVEYDKLIDAANASTDTAERLELFSAAEKLLVETDCIIIPIYHPMSSMMNGIYIKGFINQNYAATQFKTVYTVGRPETN